MTTMQTSYKLQISKQIFDGTNRTLEEIRDKKVSNETSPPGGQAGAIVVTLQRLEPYYRTQFFLVDLETGEVFGFVQQQWRHTGLYCLNQPFAVNELMNKVERHGQTMHAELEVEQQTPVMNLGIIPGQFKVPPSLPVMDELDVYVVHSDAMETNTRRNNVHDRMRAALIYISEYAETQKMWTENKYRDEDLLVRLRAVFGRVDRIRNRIDQALLQDDTHRRKRDMRFLLLPTRFPRPESMGQGDITVWTNWICEENEGIMNQLDEELIARGDPDDLFNGSAKGVFYPLQDNFSLPPPVQTPRRQEGASKPGEHLRKSPGTSSGSQQNGAEMGKGVNVGLMQGVNCELSEHSLVSPDLMRSIQNLHIQKGKTVYRTKFGMETKHILNHPNHLNLRNLISFHSHCFKDSKVQSKIKVRKQRNKEVPEEEGQRTSGSLTRNNLNRTRKFLIFP